MRRYLRLGRVLKPSAKPVLFSVIFAAAMLASCGGTPKSSAPPTIPTTSLHLSPQGTAYLQSEARLLTGFALGVAKSKIADGSRTSFPDSAIATNASEQVWYGKSLRTASDFHLDYFGTYAKTATFGRASGRGNLFVVNNGKAPPLTAVKSGPANAVLLSWRAQGGNALGAQAGEPLEAQAGDDVVLNVGSHEGGQLVIQGSQLTYTDQQGKIQAQHTFDAVDQVENGVRDVLNSDVPPASDAVVKSVCKPGVPSVVNSHVFTLSDFDASGSSQTIISLSVVRDTFTDCLTGQVTVTVRVDASGDINGHSFLAIAASPPVADTVAPDNTPAPATPPATDFTPESGDASLISLPVESDGQLPAFDGVYKGTYDGTQNSAQGATAPFSGAMTFAVAGGSIVMSAPGTGSGSVDAGGGASFGFTISQSQAAGGTGGSCEFIGSLVNSAGARTAHGSMSCQGPGNSAHATWSARGA